MIEARSVIVSTGVSYRRLEAHGLDELTGRGVYYGADASDARQVVDDDVYIVGAANSAGQAALNMAQHARRVVMLVRASGLEASMSRYLVDRIEAHPAIEVRTAQRGDGRARGRPPRVAHAARPRRRHVRGGGRELAVRLHRGRSRAPTGSARTWPATSAGTS